LPNLDVKIETERLVLVPISSTWAEEIFASFTPDVAKYMWPKPAQRLEETLAFIAGALAGLSAGSDLQLVALTRQGSFLGCIGLHSLRHRDPELGLWIRESAQGKGYGLEAANAVIAWARLQLDFDHLRYPVDKRNLASRRIPERHGGVIVREFKSVNQAGFELDQVEYWILK
jgi:[ribosomal protein S5]-alanine N-acetyltransferase